MYTAFKENKLKEIWFAKQRLSYGQRVFFMSYSTRNRDYMCLLMDL